MAWACQAAPLLDGATGAPSGERPRVEAPPGVNEPPVSPADLVRNAGGPVFAKAWTSPLGATGSATAVAEPADPSAAGKKVFMGLCASCHQPTAKGIPGAFPPLAGSDFLMADKRRSIGIVLHGLMGPVVVNGATFANVMPPQAQLTDDQISSVLSFVRSNFGNTGEPVSPQEVADVRAGHP
jgi:nitrite reductase (NO-forming)